MSITIADLAAYNPQNELMLAVEVKKKINASKKWATRLRRNILAHGYLPPDKFFLLALPDRFYLWKNKSSRSDMDEPDYEIDSKPILAPYLKQVGMTAEEMSPSNFEMLIALWLNEIMSPDKERDELTGDQSWLVESGLMDELTGGRLAHEATI